MCPVSNLAPIAAVAKASSAIMQHVNKPNPQIGGSLPVGGRKIDWKKVKTNPHKKGRNGKGCQKLTKG